MSRSAKWNTFLAPSQKSTTGAILLGGLPLSIGMFTAILINYGFSLKLLMWLIPAALLVLVGYLDDVFEIRARVKLVFQLLAVVSFGLIFTSIHNSDLVTFALIVFFGFGAMNGANLLDGIDTFSIKYLGTILAATSFVSFVYGFQPLSIFTMMCAAPLFAFYFFNKSPSKVHLGEIGGGIIGLNLLFICSELYMSLNTIKPTVFDLEAFAFAFAFMHLPMTELGISLVRRVLNKKSPFCGDKLHLHSLLVDREGMNASQASNKLNLFHFFSLTSMVLMSLVANPVAAFLFSGIFSVSYYLYFGSEFWFKEQVTRDLREYFTGVNSEHIHAYDFSSLNEFNFEFDYVEAQDSDSKKAS
jgi:UDP-GlcNAc:undecaprenyl-phosphate GlcNAc-1-phosphate transferase